ncbi:uncharacterized protein LOC124460274 [Drosophila willistoni]|uniref:uncharacterized protein LOC124460274 n=1 Tax=Drosophila willistoni TaxID=7260 RepID=UPI00017D74C8|nr:uncharacterized protein LOC124460274 [Drosophila willistoni]
MDDDADKATTTYYLEYEGNAEEWHWTGKTTKLLVELYMDRSHRFRDPKSKKRSLWSEIVNEMEQAGYKGINEDICDRKWRNMKKTYRTCREAMRNNERKRLNWEYYDTFEELYQHEFNGREQAQPSNPAIRSSQEEDDSIFEEGERAGHSASQLYLLERSKIEAIKELSRRLDESNAIQRERNELLRDFLNQF